MKPYCRFLIIRFGCFAAFLIAFTSCCCWASESFDDDFSRTNTAGPAGGLGEDWDVTGQMFINDGHAITQSPGNSVAVLKNYNLVDGISISIDLLGQANDVSGGVVFNYSSPGNYDVLRITFSDHAGSKAWQFLRFVDNKPTILSQGEVPEKIVTTQNWVQLKVVSTDTVGSYQFSVSPPGSGEKLFSQNIVDPDKHPLSGKSGFFFGGAFVFAKSFSFMTGQRSFALIPSPNDLFSPDHEATKVENAHIVINAETDLGAVNRKIFGQYIQGSDSYGIFNLGAPDQKALREGDGIWNPEDNAPQTFSIKILKSYNPGILRYPGALEIHGHDWKKTIGPIADRPFKFGLPEFMRVCEAVNATPSMVVSEYTGGPQDAADLVEYLNLPADPSHPWAMKRAADGHPEPYHVKYFEIGNESWVDWRKNVRNEVRSAWNTGVRAGEIIKAMKNVDPTILCGVPFGDSDDSNGPSWSKQVLQGAGKQVDYSVIHIYAGTYGGAALTGNMQDLLLRSILAAPTYEERKLTEFHAKIREWLGHDLPASITESNMGPIQSGGANRPYRFSLAAALAQGDFMGRMLNPDNNVLALVYWQWLNGFFGTVSTYSEGYNDLTKRDFPILLPANEIFQLWGSYFGTKLLATHVDAPQMSFEGFNGLPPMHGDKIEKSRVLSDQNLLLLGHNHPADPRFKMYFPEEGSLYLPINDLKGDAYPTFFTLTLPWTAVPRGSLLYDFSFDARWVPAPGAGTGTLGIGVMDSRGFVQSGSAIGLDGIQQTTDWKHWEGKYQPRPDTKAIDLLARLQPGGNPLNGDLEVRHMKLTTLQAEVYPASPELTAYSSLSDDGKHLHMIVFNLTLDSDLKTTITWNGFKAKDATFSEVNGKSAESVNTNGRAVGLRVDNASLPLDSSSELSHTFPIHSATEITLTKAD